VTGAQGQVGFELARTFAERCEVHAFDRQGLDVTDRRAVRERVRTLRPELIINAAAYTAVDAAETDPVTCRAVNALAPATLAEEARQGGAALLHYSTDYVFDGRKPTAYVEDDPLGPLNVYGRTKLEGEEAIASSGAAFLVLRTSWVFGARGRNFVRAMLRLFRERDVVSVVADQRGAPTWCRALADATRAVVEVPRPDCSVAEWVREIQGVYHLASAGETTWHGFATAIRDLDPRSDEHRCREILPITSEEYGAPAPRPACSVLDSSKLAHRSGVTLPHWRDQLAGCLRESASPRHALPVGAPE
jgi:dTDP-4-dehydrorhamnose reductase